MIKNKGNMSAVHSNQIFILSGTTNVPSTIAAVVAAPIQAASSSSSSESGDRRQRRFKVGSNFDN